MTTREDLYLKKLNDSSVVTPQPVTQKEKILADLAGVKGLGVELPTVTASDNGKALVVENGAWALGNASGGSGGSDDVLTGLKYVKDDPSDNGGVIEGLIELPEDAPSGMSLNSATGRCAHAEGIMTTSSNFGTHSEGGNTTASGIYSHAEGQQNTSSGNYSHTEGNGCTASKESAHAEGYQTMSQGYASHSEGYKTIASGYHSHSEGQDTKAIGHHSHASGEGTIANGQGQFVIGEYNIEQGAGTGQKVNTDYAFIIGNGTYVARSNAFAIKWDGTFVFANGTEITPAQFASLLQLLA